MARRMKENLIVLVGIGLLAAMVQPAWAQRGGGRRGFGRLFGVPKAQLATLDEVQAELKMKDEQKTRSTEINDQLRSDRRDLFGSGFESIQRNPPAAGSTESGGVPGRGRAIWMMRRSKRLQEIAIQVNGPAALNDPSVVEQLKLTDEQKTKLEEARGENNKALEDAMLDAGQQSRDERRERFRKLADTADEKLLGVLTDEQKTQFDAMKGVEIEVDLSPLFWRGRPSN